LHHAPVTNRQELRHSVRGGFDKQFDWITPFGVRFPCRVYILRALVAQRFARDPAFFTSRCHIFEYW
jgi:hypothetical protein